MRADVASALQQIAEDGPEDGTSEDDSCKRTTATVNVPDIGLIHKATLHGRTTEQRS